MYSALSARNFEVAVSQIGKKKIMIYVPIWLNIKIQWNLIINKVLGTENFLVISGFSLYQG